MNSTKNKKYKIMIVIFICSLSLMSGYFGIVEFNIERITFLRPEKAEVNATDYKRDNRSNHKDEIVLVYIGSSGCPFCNTENHYESLKKMKVRLKEKSDSLGIGFLAIGISKDFNVEEGIRHLSYNGDFDEINVGNSWNSLGVIKYIWNEFSGAPATPQVLILDREYYVSNPDLAGLTGIQEEKLLLRLIGTKSFDEWMERGAKLPNL